MKSAFITMLLVFWANSALACQGTDYEWSRTINSNKHTVKGPFTIEQLENSYLIEIRESKEMLPFGYSNEKWEKLKALYETGDKFYFVRLDDGRFFVENHVLVRGECIIGALRGAIS